MPMADIAWRAWQSAGKKGSSPRIRQGDQASFTRISLELHQHGQTQPSGSAPPGITLCTSVICLGELALPPVHDDIRVHLHDEIRVHLA